MKHTEREYCAALAELFWSIYGEEGGRTPEREDHVLDAVTTAGNMLKTCPSEIKNQTFDEAVDHLEQAIETLPDIPAIGENEMEKELRVPEVFGRED